MRFACLQGVVGNENVTLHIWLRMVSPQQAKSSVCADTQDAEGCDQTALARGFALLQSSYASIPYANKAGIQLLQARSILEFSNNIYLRWVCAARICAVLHTHAGQCGSIAVGALGCLPLKECKYRVGGCRTRAHTDAHIHTRACKLGVVWCARVCVSLAGLTAQASSTPCRSCGRTAIRHAPLWHRTDKSICPTQR